MLGFSWPQPPSIFEYLPACFVFCLICGILIAAGLLIRRTIDAHKALRLCRLVCLTDEQRSNEQQALDRARLLLRAMNFPWLTAQERRAFREEFLDLTLRHYWWKDALPFIWSLLRKEPYVAWHYAKAARCLVNTERYEKAIAIVEDAFRSASAIDHDAEISLRLNRARARIALGEPKRAVTDAEWLWQNAHDDSWQRWKYLWVLQEYGDTAGCRADFLDEIPRRFSYIAREYRGWWVCKLTWNSLCCNEVQLNRFAHIARQLLLDQANTLDADMEEQKYESAERRNDWRVQLALILCRQTFLRGNALEAQSAFEYAARLQLQVPRKREPVAEPGVLPFKVPFSAPRPTDVDKPDTKDAYREHEVPKLAAPLPENWRGTPLDYQLATYCADTSAKHFAAVSRFMSRHPVSAQLAAMYLRLLAAEDRDILELRAYFEDLDQSGAALRPAALPKLIRQSQFQRVGDDERARYVWRLSVAASLLSFRSGDATAHRIGQIAWALADVFGSAEAIPDSVFWNAQRAGEAAIAEQRNVAGELYEIAGREIAEVHDIQSRVRALAWLARSAAAADLNDLSNAMKRDAEEWKRIKWIDELAREYKLDVAETLFNARRVGSRDAEDSLLHVIMQAVARSHDIDGRIPELVRLAECCLALSRRDWAERIVLAARDQVHLFGRTLLTAQKFCGFATSIPRQLGDLRQSMIAEASQFTFQLVSSGGVDPVSRDLALRLYEEMAYWRERG